MDKLIRTFHPIGQGAFYTERHLCEDSEFTIVYDCGSTTLRREKLEKKIKLTFPKDHTIDVLFISHFHADHINGIEILRSHCKIKNVIIPLIEKTSKTLFKVANLIDSEFIDTRLIDDPESFFGGETQIIPIIPVEISQNENRIIFENPISFSETPGSSRRPSGTVFKLSTNIDWFLIPFNYKHDRRKEQFEAELNSYHLTLKDIDTIEKIKANKENIIKAYKKVDGDLNENSMVLYSGKKSEDNVCCFDHFHHFRHTYLYELLQPLDCQSACLYMGDIDLSENAIVIDINNRLKDLLPYIGTLQIPHHGSIHNFSNSILNPNICCVIFSYGTSNTYGHPSDKVISDVIARDIYPHFVTEEQTSMVVQWK